MRDDDNRIVRDRVDDRAKWLVEGAPVTANILERGDATRVGECSVPEATRDRAPGRFHRYIVARELAVGRVVLDFGCGEGYGSVLLAEVARTVVGVERSPEAVALAARQYASPNLRFALGSGAAIPLPDRSVDLAVSFESIARGEAAETLMEELKRVLRPRGRLIVSIPDEYARFDRPGDSGPILAELLGRDDLEGLVKKHFAHAAVYLQRIALASDAELPPGVVSALDKPLAAILSGLQRRLDGGHEVPVDFVNADGGRDVGLAKANGDSRKNPLRVPEKDTAGSDGRERQASDLTALPDGRQRKLEELTRQIDVRDRRILALGKALGEREGELAALSRKLGRREQQVVALKEGLRRHAVQVSKLRDEALAVSSLQGQIRALEKSRSWRFTASLRAIGSLLRRARHAFRPEVPRRQDAVRHSLHRKARATGAPIFPIRGLFPPDQIYPMRLSASEPLAAFDHPPEVRALAFYLPQYHVNPENDAWWGKGFTDWDNVRKARPLFTNHDQPRIPSELGFYDLSVEETIERQAALIRRAGLEGVCIYYYWFNGKRLLDKPLELIYENEDIDLKYCLCWANENWTRAWDGFDDDVLITQTYSESDDLEFIASLTKYFADERYIRVHGKPLLLLYRLDSLPDPKESIARWRQYCLETGIGEIYVMTAQVTDDAPEHLGADGGFEFPPHRLSGPAFNGVRDVHGLSPLFDGGIHDYNEMVLNSIARKPNRRIARTATMAWDNSARRRNGEPTIFINATPARYERWLSRLCRETKSKDPEERLVFVNAWNEWAEGVYLEPDRARGYAHINATRRAVSRCDESIPRIAVVLHMFYWDLVDEIADYISNIPVPFDLYVTATEGIYPQAFSYFNQRFPEASVNVAEVENRARDIGPFLTRYTSRYYDYDLVCKVHSKKSPHAPNLGGWRTFLLDRLLGNEARVREILDEFDRDPKLGLLYPTYFPEIRSSISWGTNLYIMKDLLSSLEIEFDPMSPCTFPAGSMFWFRPQALSSLFEIDFMIEEFPEETGQTDGTLAHAIERSFLFVVEHNKHHYRVID
jgi:lipopolysaccharide biosynthesis protein/SAM-dependent methyltransferase